MPCLLMIVTASLVLLAQSSDIKQVDTLFDNDQRVDIGERMLPSLITSPGELEIPPLEDIHTGTRPLVKSPGRGGKNGDTFDDLSEFDISPVQIDGVYSIDISGKLLDQLTITTTGPHPNETNIYGPFGKTGKQDFSFEGYIMGFHGRAEDRLTNIGVYTVAPLKQSKVYGGKGGEEFDDCLDPLSRGLPFMAVSHFYIYYGNYINGIQAMYRLLDNSPSIGAQHGSENETMEIIAFRIGEQFVELHGAVENGIVSQIAFITRTTDGKFWKYGPVGKGDGKPFVIRGTNMYIFRGRVGNQLNSIGVYYF